MNRNVLCRENQMFFVTQLAPELLSDRFEHIVANTAVRERYYRKLSEVDKRLMPKEERFGTMTFQQGNGELGYVQIGPHSAVNLTDADDPYWFSSIPISICGDLNNQCTLTKRGYTMHINIIGYETPDGIVVDPIRCDNIEDTTPLGRVVIIFVTCGDEKPPEEELLCIWSDKLTLEPV